MYLYQPQGQLARWREQLSQFDKTMNHQGLTRMPALTGDWVPTMLNFQWEDFLCGGCLNCDVDFAHSLSAIAGSVRARNSLSAITMGVSTVVSVGVASFFILKGERAGAPAEENCVNT